jgi:hypothetical protein
VIVGVPLGAPVPVDNPQEVIQACSRSSSDA